MFFSRVASFVALAGFSLLACAAPTGDVDNSNISVLKNSGVNAPVTVTTRDLCGCGGDLLDVLLDLQVEVDAQVLLLDGVNSHTNPCNAIVVAIKAAVVVIAKLDIKADVFTKAQIDACVAVIVHICISIAAALGKYGLLAIIAICAQIDLCLALLINICINACPLLLAEIKAGLLADLHILAVVKLVLTIASCGM